MKDILFARLNPNGNFKYEGKFYVNGDSASFPDNVADALISCGMAIDVNADQEFAKKMKRTLEADNARRNKILNKIEKRR